MAEQAVASARILIVDDNMNALKALGYLLEREGFEVECAQSGEIALERLRRTAIDVVVSDVRMPGLTGLELLESIRSSHPDIPVVILTAHGSIENAVDAVRLGASDYLQKPYQPVEIGERVRRALERRQLPRPGDQGAKPAVPALEAPPPAHTSLEAMVGVSAAMVRLKGQIRTIAAKDIAVILYGDSGTGKELAARAIHEGSPRRDRPFVAVNCASIPETLLENELFGHMKGAYTGAQSSAKGLFEEADTGTIFLDEIGEVPASIQAKLLRVLQEQEFKKIGGTRDVRVDVRIVTATNRDLREAVASGRFREDLYYRINVVPLSLPPLRDRAEDIPLLARHFLTCFNAELGLAVRGLSDDAIAQMVNYRWPGNVRELRNRVKMAMVMAKTTTLSAEDLAFGDGEKRPAFPAFRDAKESFEKEYVVRALRMCGGNVKKAAQLAGRDRSTFYDLLKKHEIAADTFRDLY